MFQHMWVAKENQCNDHKKNALSSVLKTFVSHIGTENTHHIKYSIDDNKLNRKIVQWLFEFENFPGILEKFKIEKVQIQIVKIR